MAACEVAIDLGLHGPVSASALACASGTYALLEARRWILSGEADVVLAGGADASITAALFAGLSKMGPMSERNDDPEHASRPFDGDVTASCSARARSCWSSSPPNTPPPAGPRSTEPWPAAR